MQSSDVTDGGQHAVSAAQPRSLGIIYSINSTVSLPSGAVCIITAPAAAAAVARCKSVATRSLSYGDYLTAQRFREL